MIRKVEILTKSNQYESKRHFSYKLAEAFIRAGLEAVVFDSDSGDFIQEWERRQKSDCDLACSFNRFARGPKGYLWEHIKTRFVSFLIDPIIYDMQTVASPNALVTCVDRGDCMYADAMGNKNVAFMPHAIEKDIAAGNGERPYPVVFIGSSYDPENLKSYWQKHLAAGFCEIIEESIRNAFEEVETSFLRAVLKALQRRGLKPEDVPFRDLYYYVDYYMRGYDRVELIRAIKDVEVHVFGGTCWRKEAPIAGWNYYLGLQPNVVLHPAVTFSEVLDILKKSKLCLNSVPTLRDGSHERVFSSYACGALPVSSENLYWREQFGDSIVLYPYDNRAYAAERIKELLANEPMRQSMVDKGREITMKRHTWDNRVVFLLEQLQKWGV